MNNNKLVQDCLFNFEDLIDFLFKYTEKITFFSGVSNKDINIDKHVDRLLDFEANRLMKDAFICTRSVNVSDDFTSFYLDFAVNNNSRKWILKHKSIQAFNKYYSQLSCTPQMETEAYKNGWELDCPSFIDAKGRTIIDFKENICDIDINENYVELFEFWSKTTIQNKINEFKSFAEEFKHFIENNDDDTLIVNHFSSNKYPYYLFIKILNNFNVGRAGINEYEYLNLSEFYSDQGYITKIIKILILKLKYEFKYDVALDLFTIYNTDNIAITNEIDDYFCELNTKLFVELFNKALDKRIQVRNRKGIVIFISNMIALWRKKGVNDSYGLRGFVILKDNFEDKAEFNLSIPHYDMQYFNKNFALCVLLYISVWKCSHKVKIDYLKKLETENFMICGHFIAWNCLYGIVGAKNSKKAFKILYKISQEFKESTHHVECQFDLARCYLHGWGTEKDLEQAKYWFGKAAENGHPKAQAQLALINNKG